MKIKAKNNETMFWVDKFREMVSFEKGFAQVDDKVGKEMINKFGYQEVVGTTKENDVETTEKVENQEQPKFKN